MVCRNATASSMDSLVSVPPPGPSIIAAVMSFETMIGYSGEVDACIMNDSLKRECGIGAAAVADVQERRLRERRQQLVRGVRRENGRALVVLRVAMHRMAVAIERVEARVRVPGLVEMDAVDAGIEQLLDAPRVVAQPVVRGVRDDRVDRARLDALGRQRIGLDRGLDGLLAEPRRRNGADDSVAVAQRHEIGRNAARHDQAVLDRLVTVAVAQRDLVAAHGRHEDHAVRHRRAVGDAVRAVRAEDARRIFLVLADRARMIEQRAEAADADRKVGAQQVFAEVVEEDPAHRRLEKSRAALVAGRVPRILVVLA